MGKPPWCHGVGMWSRDGSDIQVGSPWTRNEHACAAMVRRRRKVTRNYEQAAGGFTAGNSTMLHNPASGGNTYLLRRSTDRTLINRSPFLFPFNLVIADFEFRIPGATPRISRPEPGTLDALQTGNQQDHGPCRTGHPMWLRVDPRLDFLVFFAQSLSYVQVLQGTRVIQVLILRTSASSGTRPGPTRPSLVLIRSRRPGLSPFPSRKLFTIQDRHDFNIIATTSAP